MTLSGVHKHLQKVYGCHTAPSTIYRADIEQLYQQVTGPQKVDTPFVGSDESSRGKGQDYSVVLVDLARRKVIDLDSGGKTKKAAKRLLEKVDSESLKAHASDMWKPLKIACQQMVPHALVVDHFHVIKP